MSDLSTEAPAAPATQPAEPPASTPPSTSTPGAAEPPKPGATAAPGDSPPGDPDRWPRSAKEWDQFKAVRNENYRKRDERIAKLEKELKAREDRLAAFANAVDPKEHSSVREERDKLSEALRLAAVEKHPRFQAYYDGKLTAQMELAKRIAGPERGEALTTVLKMPDSEYRNMRIEELMGELSPMAANRLGSIINTVDELRTEREQEITKAREDYDKMSARQQAEQQAALASQRASAEKLFADTLAEAQAGGLPMLAPKEGDAAWNAAVDQRVARAKAILFGQEPPDQLVRSALAAVSFPAILESHAALAAENEQLRAQVAQLRTATPTTSRGTAPATPGGGDRQPAKTGSRPMQAAAEWIGLLNQEPAA